MPPFSPTDVDVPLSLIVTPAVSSSVTVADTLPMDRLAV